MTSTSTAALNSERGQHASRIDMTSNEDLERIIQREAKGHFHPLEAIPFFRRWPHSFLRNIVYTFIFNIGWALLFFTFGVMFSRLKTPADYLQLLTSNFVIAQAIGFMFHFVYSGLGPLMAVFNRLSFFPMVLAYTVLGNVVCALGMYAASFIPGYEFIRSQWMGTPQWFIAMFALSLIISTVLGIAYRSRIFGLVREAQLARVQEREASLEREVAIANLKLLQAQIEPHFLFNTLANVRSLVDSSPDKAKAMLDALNQLLRASLKQTRGNDTTLGHELDLLQHYLTILKIRMEGRLEFSVDAPEAVRALTMPPMLLQPLVENAIKHGIEPKVNGGRVDIAVKENAGSVLIDIADTGLGFNPGASTQGTGVGLANVRERLKGYWGDRAKVSVQENVPSGTRIVLTLPASTSA